ncbi:MAG: aminotransferase class III-fold pyridoxal phosphate-dependent enzyme [Rubripirellula sp.]
MNVRLAPHESTTLFFVCGRNPKMWEVVQEVMNRQPTSMGWNLKSLDSLSATPALLAYEGPVLPPCVERAEGARFTDLDGNEFIDCHMAYSAAILGHNPTSVVTAVQQAIGRGIGVGQFFQEQCELAELVQALVPGVERVAYFHTGGEAIQAAVRMARCATGKTKIAKFEGCYHGSNEVGLYNPWMSLSGGIPDDPLDNITPQVATGGLGATQDSEYLILPFNSDVAFDLIRKQASELAAIVVEPMPSFMSPYPEVCKKFMLALHALASELDVPLIFDEVVCGFRLALGGAREWLGVAPQISCFGKITSGLGLPLSMVAGDAKFLDAGRSDGLGRDHADRKVWVSSTAQAGFLPIIAAFAQLRHLQDNFTTITQRLDENFRDLSERLEDVSQKLGVPVRLAGNPRTQVHLDVGEVKPESIDYRAIMNASSAANFRALMAMTFYLRLRGVYTKLVPSMNFSAAHGEQEMEELATHIQSSVEQMLLDQALVPEACTR